MRLSSPARSSQKNRYDPCVLFFLIVVLIVNLILTACLVTQTRRRSQISAREYSYVGDDFPVWWEQDWSPVEMTFGETSRYTLQGPLADAEWESIRKGNYQGYIRLGPERRLFAVDMLHQLHCVNTFRKGLTHLDEESYKENEHHMGHCLNYLRELFLCAADTTLEPYDYRALNFTTERVGFTRQCRDWSKIYERMDKDAADWKAYAIKYNEEHNEA